MMIISDKEKKEMNKEIISWVRKELKEKNWTYLYNWLLSLKQLYENK